MKYLGQKVLWLRARDYLKRYQPLLIGVTGSTGKTLTKEAIALALKDHRHVRVSPQSYNTPIGVALSILGVSAPYSRWGWVRLLSRSLVREVSRPEPDTIILELGADRPGDIGFLVKQARITIGVVTNISSTHLRLFTSKEMVAHEKMALITSLPRDGFAILNQDDPLVAHMHTHTPATVIWYGTSRETHIGLVRAERLSTGGFALEVTVNGQHYELSLRNIIARHQLGSVLAALAIASALKISTKQAIANLQNLIPPPGRMRLFVGKRGSGLIDDSYNASPEATLAALQTLKELPGRRKIAILGDMLDLGSETISWHEKIGEQAASIADIFIGVGQQMRHAQARALRTQNVDCHHFEDSRDVGKWLIDFLRPGDLVLIKGSRAMHMEHVTKRLLANPKRDGKYIVKSWLDPRDY